MHIYRIQNNEDIYSIAREFGTSPMKISEDNELTVRSSLPSGREILVIIPTRTYNVKSNDTLDIISRKFGVKKDALQRMNPELKGREKLYPGQLLTVKNESGSYGMINTNGYFYRGCNIENLIRAIPYLGYVTVCSAVYKNGNIHNLFRTDEAVSLIRSVGRVPLVRVYLTELPDSAKTANFINSITILAKSGHFSGVTLSSPLGMKRDAKELEAFILEMRRALMESDLLLFAEGDAECNTSYMEYADAGILTYDKIHKKDIPTFADGEEATLTAFSESGESSRTFLEIPSFAYTSGKHIDKSEAMKITDRKRGEISCDDDRKIAVTRYGKNKSKEIIYESLTNTKAKLNLISELGFMGVCFDIGRVCLCDLMMMSTMFEVITHPIIGSV